MENSELEHPHPREIAGEIIPAPDEHAAAIARSKSLTQEERDLEEKKSQIRAFRLLINNHKANAASKGDWTDWDQAFLDKFQEKLDRLETEVGQADRAQDEADSPEREVA